MSVDERCTDCDCSDRICEDRTDLYDVVSGC